MIKQITATVLCLSALCKGLAAPLPAPDEGMWLPMYLKQLNEKDMKSEGMRINADDIYNINRSSIKDAVVSLGGFCTGEIVSPDGLMLTNHHCGYEKIAEHSTVEHDYLKNGFWAKTHSDELPNPGLTASVLVYMKDVSDIVKSRVQIGFDDMSQQKIEVVKDSIAQAATKGTHYKAEVKSFFKSSEYYLLVYEVFQDVRLVGAPPSSIGKFGGDVDNWMWPRHTGDFSVFRIYVDKDGNPAPYSVNNVPYKPKSFFKISLKGEKKNDYAMVMGYPGNTDRYQTSYDLIVDRDYTNPAIIDVFETQLSVMKADMDADPNLKIKLAADYASYSNTYKYYLGQEQQLKRNNVIDLKKAQEEQFKAWVDQNEDRKKKYGKIFDNISYADEQYKTIEPALSYFFYGFFNTGLTKYAFAYAPYARYLQDEKVKPAQADLDTVAIHIKPQAVEYLNSATFNTDKKIFRQMLINMYHKVPDGSRPELLDQIVKDNKKAASPEEAISQYVDKLYEKSILLNKDKTPAFLDKVNAKKLRNDPLYTLMFSMIKYYVTHLNMVYETVTTVLAQEHSLYQQGLREWQPNRIFYPDANSTLRLSYGKVLPYLPRDGVEYDYYTTYKGILEKYDSANPEFVVPQRELDLFKQKNFGRYAQNDTLRINFLANTDITGGNSGSPILDADGNLIGLAFDGDWESMSSDLYYNPATNRTICVDIRYVLWVMDIYANAKNLVDEMTIMK